MVRHAWHIMRSPSVPPACAVMPLFTLQWVPDTGLVRLVIAPHKWARGGGRDPSECILDPHSKTAKLQIAIGDLEYL